MAKQTKQEYVYKYIYTRIYTCEYPPGTPLTEEELSEKLNVSRTPVREALRRLNANGLIESTPGVGLSVSQIRIEDLLEIYEMRMGLEALAVKLFIEKRNADLITELESCIMQVKKATAYEDIDTYMLNDMRFHKIISAGAKNKRLSSMLDNIYTQINRMSNYVRSDPDIREITIDEHKKILDAIKNNEVRPAIKASEEHCISGRNFYLKQVYNI